MQFRNRRQRIETIAVELRESLAQDNDRGIDQSYADLQDALYELNEKSEYYSEDEDDDLFGSIRSVFTGERDRKCLEGERNVWQRDSFLFQRRFKPKASQLPR